VSIWVVAGEVSFIVLILLFLLFSIYSLLEKEKRAFWRSLVLFLLIAAIDIFFLFISIPLKNYLFGTVFVLSVVILLILICSPSPKQAMKFIGKPRKIDERDVIFARFDYREGTKIFREYYERRPEYKKIDDDIRKIPDILSAPHMKKNPLHYSLADAEFNFLENQLTQVGGKISPEKVELSPSENSRMIKNIIKYLGSELCGICALKQEYIYSYVGRGPEPYSKKIEVNHKYAIVFALEMDFEMVAMAPKAPVLVETGKKYVEAAKISIIAADFIRHLGYSARAHIAGSNYQAILPPLGWKAGLGELGRMSILITRKFGPRVRLGLITTDLPLTLDKPVKLGIQDFCQKCQKCARNCPAQAIPYGEKAEENGVFKWVLNREECYRFWRKAGTDCAVCIFVCPYSKPDNLFHNLIRKITSKSSFAQSLSVWGDDFFYGRIPICHKKPPLDI